MVRHRSRDRRPVHRHRMLRLEFPNPPTTDNPSVHASLKNWQSWAVSALIALVPLSFSVDWRIKALPPALLFLTGLVVLIRSSSARRTFRVDAWPPVAAALLLVAFEICNALIHQSGWRPLDGPAHVLLYLVMAACFTLPLRMRVVWMGFSLTAIALGAVAMVQHHGLGASRAYGLNGGPSAAIELATILVGLSCAALTQCLSSATPRHERIVHAVALAFGTYGALLTQSRGPLAALVPAFALLVVLQIKRSGRWRASVLLTGAACLIAAATLSKHNEVVTRFEVIAPEISSFDHHADTHGSIHDRLAMWRTAARALVSHPLTGIGADRFDEYARQEIAAGRSSPVIGQFNQPHNEYLSAAAAGGFPGLLATLLMFVVPLLYFGRHVFDPDREVALPASFGLALVALYMVCALTDSVFYRVMTQSFYFFPVLGLALRIGQLKQAGVMQAGAAGDGHAGREASPAGRAGPDIS